MKNRKRKSLHHRLPRSLGGTNEPSNLVEVAHNRHMAWHQCFTNKTAKQIVWELNNIWLPADVMVILVEKPKDDPKQMKFFE